MMRVYFINMVLIAIGLITSKITFLILILSYIWLGFQTNTELIFYVLSLFHQLTMALSVMIPINMAKAAAFHAAFIRLNKVLQAEELRKMDNEYPEKPSIEIKGASVKIGETIILKEISLQISNSTLVVVTGPVGSGKSALLKLILQDYPLLDGKIFILRNNFVP